MSDRADSADEAPRLGIRQNLGQFSLLVLINAFVGGMVGLERTIVPLLGSEEFRLASTSAITAFIVSFGVTKALVDLVSGPIADRWGRKPVLVLGWLLGIPVPFLIIWAPTWSWIIAANVLLGANQGFAWSMTVLMKIDLAGPARRGLAMGLNEFGGYGAVGLTALVTGYIAASAGLRPKPFYLGIGYAFEGFLLSACLVRETGGHVEHEARSTRHDNVHPSHGGPEQATFWNIFAYTSWRNRTLFGVCQAGLVNNLNDGMAWGIFPLFFAAHGLAVADIGVIKAVYPFVWALGQLVTGPLSDRWGRKGLIVWGMWLQALAHPLIAFGAHLNVWASGVSGSILLGLGTSMVYPSLLAAVSDVVHPVWRARSLSLYRAWRDLGYAVGAAIAGLVAGALSLAWSIHVAGLLTFVSGLIAWLSVRETRQRKSA
ncbi:MAG TPA: MFS transporter [Bryobacteraceae bacterium]|nr:MFS transporter [Bryobacteraceae bacterium]